MADEKALTFTIAPDDGRPSFSITEAQYDALSRKFQQNPDGSPHFPAFRRRACIGIGGVLMIHWCGMWLGIEPDGYTHS